MDCEPLSTADCDRATSFESPEIDAGASHYCYWAARHEFPSIAMVGDGVTFSFAAQENCEDRATEVSQGVFDDVLA